MKKSTNYRNFRNYHYRKRRALKKRRANNQLWMLNTIEGKFIKNASLCPIFHTTVESQTTIAKKPKKKEKKKKNKESRHAIVERTSEESPASSRQQQVESKQQKKLQNLTTKTTTQQQNEKQQKIDEKQQIKQQQQEKQTQPQSQSQSQQQEKKLQAQSQLQSQQQEQQQTKPKIKEKQQENKKPRQQLQPKSEQVEEPQQQRSLKNSEKSDTNLNNNKEQQQKKQQQKRSNKTQPKEDAEVVALKDVEPLESESRDAESTRNEATQTQRETKKAQREERKSQNSESTNDAEKVFVIKAEVDTFKNDKAANSQAKQSGDYDSKPVVVDAVMIAEQLRVDVSNQESNNNDQITPHTKCSVDSGVELSCSNSSTFSPTTNPTSTSTPKNAEEKQLAQDNVEDLVESMKQSFQVFSSMKDESNNRKKYDLELIKPMDAHPYRSKIRRRAGLGLLPRDIEYCLYMMETYADNYEAMVKDERNVYADDTSALARKIRIFRDSTHYRDYVASRSATPQPQFSAL